MIETIANLIGIMGVVLILIGYMLIQSGKLTADNIKFPLANLVGASMILFSLIFAWNLPSFIIELFWVLISFFGIVRIVIKNKKGSP